MIWALLLACGSDLKDLPLPLGEEPTVEVRLTLDGEVRAGGGAVRLQVAYDPEGRVELPEPAAEGVEFTPDGPPLVERVGDRDVVTQRFVFAAKSGSYEIPPVVVSWKGKDGAEQEASSASVFVDVGVEPPREGEIADIVEPGAVRRIPWVPFAAVGALMAAGVLFAFRPRRRAAPPPPPLPPDVVALEAWERVRDDPSLDVDAKARALSELFRAYVEGVLGFEATARTTFEILEHLGSLTHLPQGNIPRAKRILRATDLVKYAEERPGAAEEWLAELDADLRAFVEATRPVTFHRPPAATGSRP